MAKRTIPELGNKKVTSSTATAIKGGRKLKKVTGSSSIKRRSTARGV